MYLGGNCISCHLEEDHDDDVPRYTAAGTVMLGLHERDNCGGLEGAVVEITGADGQVISLRTNRTGISSRSEGSRRRTLRWFPIKGGRSRW